MPQHAIFENDTVKLIYDIKIVSSSIFSATLCSNIWEFIKLHIQEDRKWDLLNRLVIIFIVWSIASSYIGYYRTCTCRMEYFTVNILHLAMYSF